MARIERRRCAIEHLDRLREALSAAEREPSTMAASAAAAAFGAVSTACCKWSGQSATPTLASAMPRSSSNADRSPGGGGSASARRRKTADSGAPCFAAAQAVSTSRSTTRIGGGLADEQVLGNPLVSVRLLSEQLSGTAVATSALGGGELRIDSAADDRMDERQRPAGLRIRGRQQLGCLSCLDLFEASESRRLE